jgi:conjugative relaxase-like TrwC/TraI family protein
MIMARSVAAGDRREGGSGLMTGTLKIHVIHDVEYYLARAGGPSDYYLTPASSGKEPPGVWTGEGARDLGLTGFVDPAVMKALYEKGIAPDGRQIGQKRRPVYLGNEGRTDELQEKINEAIRAEMEAKGPFITPERRREIANEIKGKVRHHVLGWDLTWGLTKSVSLTHAGLLTQVSEALEGGDEAGAAAYQQQANQIVDAIRETYGEIIALVEHEACYTRTGGHHGAGGDGAFRDARGLTVAAFLQSTSRDGDPHLHVHGVALNLVQRADGEDDKYRAIDAEPLLHMRGKIDAIGKRILADKLERLGIPLVQRPDGDGFEVGGVEQAQIDVFSSRRTKVEQDTWVRKNKSRKRSKCGCVCSRGECCNGCGHGDCPWERAKGVRPLIEAYTEKHGRPPSRAVVWSMHEHAFYGDRKRKEDEHATPAEQLAAWEARAAEHKVASLSSIPAAVARYEAEHGGAARAERRATAAEPMVLEADGSARPLTEAERHRAVRIAVEQVQRGSSTWHASDLAGEIQRALPHLAPGTDFAALMEQCLTEAISNEVDGAEIVWLGKPPDVTDTSVLGLRASDGQSVYRKARADKYCTLDHLDKEDFLLRAAARRMRPKMTPEEAAAALEGRGLSDQQREAAEMLLATDRQTIVFVGPAGTGKSFTLAAVASAYSEHTGGRVIGLALAKNAVRILQSEGIGEAYTIADFLGQLPDGTSRGHIEVRPGDLLIVDESSQVPTDHALAQVQDIANRAGAWMIDAGDTEQMGSPEAGGMMRLIASEHGYVQIREVRRFEQPWEGSASLRLRSGDASVIAEYRQHGRVYEGRRDDMYARAVRNWLGDWLAAEQTGLLPVLLAASNTEAAEMSALAREQLIRLDRVRNSGDIALERDGNDASVGDLLRARLNSKIAAGGKPLENRDVVRLEGWWAHGIRRHALMRRQLSGGGWSGQFLVPESYVKQHMELAYAGNVDVAEGKTTRGGAHLLVSPGMRRSHLYTGMSRDTGKNGMYVVTAEEAGRHIGGERPAPELTREAHEQPVTAEGVVEAIMAREPGEVTATAVLRESRAFPASMPHLHKLWQVTTRGQAYPAFDRALRERLNPDEYARYLREPQREALHQQLRRVQMAGRDAGDLLDQVLSRRSVDGADSIAAVIHGRIERLGLPRFGTADTYTERTPDISDPDYARIARATAEAMDEKQLELGEEVTRRPPVWAVRYLGLPPREEGALRKDWVRRAGIAEGYRQLAGHDDRAEAIGELPRGGTELREAWAAAARALEMPEEESDVRIASRGQLEGLVRAYERVQAWAPEYVADRLEETSLAAQNTGATARIAEAMAQTSGLARDKLRAARAQADAEGLEAKRALLEEVSVARSEWAEHFEPARVKANEAAMELARREEAKARAKAKARPDAGGSGGSEAQPQPKPQPEPDRTDDELADLARLARERIRMEKEAEERDPWEREPWEEQAEAEASATWQPGRADAQPGAQLEAET